MRLVRPNFLAGARKKPRPGEKVAVAVLAFANSVGLARRHRVTPGEVVARAMLNAGFDSASGTRTITQDEVFTEADLSR